MHPILILILGAAVVIASIVWLRIGAFFGLVLAAIVVSLLAPGELTDKIPRVVAALGTTAGNISVVIACAAVIGKCMMDSGAAATIVSTALDLFGEKRSPIALLSSGFVLSVPVFFDTVFYLLVPLARSLHSQTRKHYVLYISAIASGAAITHTLVPPTPGPLAMAENLSVDVGLMMIMGVAVAIPSAIAALVFAHWQDKRLDIPMRPLSGESQSEESRSEKPNQSGKESIDESALPGFLVSIAPIVLPVILISANTIRSTVIGSRGESETLPVWHSMVQVLGNPNIALLIATACALALFVVQRKPSAKNVASSIENALMSAGAIILITSAGGAFGAMLKAANVGAAIQGIFEVNSSSSAVAILFIGWVTACLMKISQGSSTVAMITASSIVAAMIDPSAMPVHPVYVALAIGCGSLFVSWMNDSGFWIVAKMSGFTEMETIKTWTMSLIILSLVGLAVTILLALAMPMVDA